MVGGQQRRHWRVSGTQGWQAAGKNLGLPVRGVPIPLVGISLSGIGRSWEVAGLLGTQQVKPAALQLSHPAGPGYLASLLTAEYPLCAEVGVRGLGVTLGRGLAGLDINQPQALNLTILKNEMAPWISRSCSELWRALL